MKKALLLPLVLLPFLTYGQAQHNPQERLQELGIKLPAAEKPVANFVNYVQAGNLLFLSGHAYCGPSTAVDHGKLGRDLTTSQGYEAARRATLCLLATLHEATGGDLNKVKRIVKVLGMVNSAENYTEQSKVVNGCSDLLVDVFGDKGKHARAAVGMAALPGNLSVEIEMVVELYETEGK
ncbi:enamine deaminase RidA (YjgF/YER057c/UK114 family) [Pontibacter ummariensis]|uniref:Enamine deaminase RidA, house cleaning of reactive enamine intermediates, YjgF/YER057c/UK114 family n=1 Tax=Pontibacter ummariensis TaxID=1610492 RepID=A0A239LI67_9BACT|nr:RidA family protein [Pontibacter ummariensis]PRY03131.1 enamine deaminase RidA (YjgF/YER057c/UK114 family) [Pontibacter ummariensis]SNT30286.1 Enamine deaminase RidA, house cleaning of reactive enamine intermediates, YjgF/YER057c/UK114 family [Pontibacter ummariensis]